MRFLVDAQLPPDLAALLRRQGHEVEHVYDVSLHDAADAPIRAYAESVGAVLITKDRDFVSSEPARHSIQVVWIRTGNISNRALFERVESRWPEVEAYLAEGNRIVELR